jgi:hypothetical protein
MTFKLAINPFFWATVKMSLVGDMGKRVEGAFKAKFRRLSQQQYEALLERLRLPVQPPARPGDSAEGDGPIAAGGADASEVEPQAQQWRITDKEVLDMVLLDWDDLVDEDDQKIPYTPDNLERLEGVLSARASLVQAFFDAHVKAPEKNSGTRRGASTT